MGYLKMKVENHDAVAFDLGILFSIFNSEAYLEKQVGNIYRNKVIDLIFTFALAVFLKKEEKLKEKQEESQRDFAVLLECLANENLPFREKCLVYIWTLWRVRSLGKLYLNQNQKNLFENLFAANPETKLAFLQMSLFYSINSMN